MSPFLFHFRFSERKTMRKYFISVCSYYSDPVKGTIVKNPNYQKHALESMEKTFSCPREALKLCADLRSADGTVAFVINGQTGNQVVINCETGEIEEFNGDDACGQ